MSGADAGGDLRRHAPVLEGPYRPRPVRFLELWRYGEWHLKLYGISCRHPRPGAELVEAAKRAAAGRFPEPAVTEDRYGMGFVIAHEGREANFVLLDWWVGENMLQHHVYRSPLDRPGELEYLSPTGIGACVWELEVLHFERTAWVETVLANPAGPDPGAYLLRRLDARV